MVQILPRGSLSVKRMYLGVGVGIVNFAGFATFLLALSTGDVSRVGTITSLYLIIPIGISLFANRLTLQTRGYGILGILMSLAAIGLMR